MTTLFVSVTDTEGLPIDGARIQANAFLTKTRKAASAVSITALALVPTKFACPCGWLGYGQSPCLSGPGALSRSTTRSLYR
jgi:hypothetical protein